MTPPAELLASAPDAAPSLLGAALQMIAALAAFGALAWLLIAWQRKVRGPMRHMEVLDRTVLARGASVALLRVGTRRLLVGVGGDGVRLLRDLDAEDGAVSKGSFDRALEEAVARREETP